MRPVVNLVESFVDNAFRDKVHPEVGSILYCDYLFGYAEHSGVYVGDDRIVSLTRSGIIEEADPPKFMEGKTAIGIYISCNDDQAVGSETVARRAMQMVGMQRDYNFLFDNCHQFTSGCLTGDFENSNSFLWMLKSETEEVLGADTWRVWDIDAEHV